MLSLPLLLPPWEQGLATGAEILCACWNETSHIGQTLGIEQPKDVVDKWWMIGGDLFQPNARKHNHDKGKTSFNG